MGDNGVPGGNVRVSDADRNEVIERLRACTAEGRLTLEEFEERVAEVYEARTGDELRHALRQLPSPTLRPTGRGRRRGVAQSGGGWFVPPVLVVVAIAVAIVVLTPARFPLIPIAFWAVVALTVLRRRRRRAPAND